MGVGASSLAGIFAPPRFETQGTRIATALFDNGRERNTERPHQGCGMKGRTPAEVFVRCLPKPKTPREER